MEKVVVCCVSWVLLSIIVSLLLGPALRKLQPTENNGANNQSGKTGKGYE